MAAKSTVTVLLVSCVLGAQTPEVRIRPLTLQEAIREAVAHNLQVAIAQQNRLRSQAGVVTSQGAFDWNLAASAQSTYSKRETSVPLYPGFPALPYQSKNSSRQAQAELSTATPWGGTFQVQESANYSYWHNVLLDTTGKPVPGSESINPFPWSGQLIASYSQKLLQGFGTEMGMAPLVIARRNAQAADATFRLSVIDLVAQTENAYWAQVYAEHLLESKKSVLALAEKHRAESQIRLKVGAIARLDLTGAEAQVAQAEQDILAAQNQLDNARDTLARILSPDGVDVTVQLKAVDQPALMQHLKVAEVDDAVAMALRNRLELQTARANLDVARLQRKVAQDKIRPDLTVAGTYIGTSNSHEVFGPAQADLSHARYPGYAASVSLAMPLQNRAAKGGLQNAQATEKLGDLSLKDQEQAIILQVRTAYRNMDSAEFGLVAAAKTLNLQEKVLAAEQKKFSRGASTSFIVLQKMTDLDNARTREVQAQTTFANAVTGLEQAVGHLLEARNLDVK
jgi:outer membrane protein